MCSDQKLILSDPLAFGTIHLHDYFHDFTYFIELIMIIFEKYWLELIATLSVAMALS
jgi:hypothetical protein